MIAAVLNGELENVPMHKDEFFGLEIPEHVPGVPDNVLDPRKTWPNSEEYDRKALEMVNRFKENYKLSNKRGSFLAKEKIQGRRHILPVDASNKNRFCKNGRPSCVSMSLSILNPVIIIGEIGNL